MTLYSLLLFAGLFMVPTIYNWNLTVEHQLAPNWMLRLAYYGIRRLADAPPACSSAGAKMPIG